MLFREDNLRKKEQWYRLPERELVQTKADKRLIGSIWNVKRHVARAGYYFEHFDPEIISGYDDECHKIMMDLFELQYRQMPEGLSQAEFERINKRIEASIESTAEKYGYPNKMKYQARGTLVQRAYRDSGKEKLRAIWYLDINCPGENGWEVHLPTLKIVGIKQCWTGKYYPPSGGGYGDDDYDYEPGGLDNQVHHSLYKVIMSDPWYEPVWKDPEGEWLESYGHTTLVHPEDLIPLKPIPMSGEWIGDTKRARNISHDEFRKLTEGMSESEYRKLREGRWENAFHKI